jgi:UTP--glucose-1-phosphate uridylyltransferase
VQIKKAVITAAGKSQRTLPLQTLVDRDGSPKNRAGHHRRRSAQGRDRGICVVICPGDQAAYRAAAGPHASRLQFVEQPAPLGYGHAVHCAPSSPAAAPFLLLVGDHLYVSRAEKNCAQQLVEAASAESCAVSAVQATHESKLPFYGAVGGRLVPAGSAFTKSTVLEKPTPTEAEQRLIVPGLARRTLPLLFRHARFDADGHGTLGEMAAAGKSGFP